MTKNKKHKNIEIKAKCNNISRIRKILVSEKAIYKGKDHQIDTYYQVKSGRLKLREGNIENQLIFYQRKEKKGIKKSQVIYENFNPKGNLKKILNEIFKVLVVVDKQREIYFIQNIKFHLDNVKNLGTFVEIEARDEKGIFSEEKLMNQCKKYIKEFNINEKDLIDSSYSDLIKNYDKE